MTSSGYLALMSWSLLPSPLRPLLNVKKFSYFCLLISDMHRSFWIFLVVFPQDLLEKGLDANNFAMLGLGDIVIPGIFIALLLRFDNRFFVQRVHVQMVFPNVISFFII